MKKIALIDSGIHSEFLSCVDCFYHIEENRIISNMNTGSVDSTHGGICAYILRKYVSDCKVYSLEILEENGKTNIKKLKIALEWCLDNEVDLISLSLGSTDLFKSNELYESVKKLYLKNIFIIAAANNCNSITYPASFEEVFGVKCDLSGLLSKGEILVDTSDIRNIEISVGSLKECRDMEKFNLSYHNSFVVPYVTAKIANILEENPNLNKVEVLEYLGTINNDYITEKFYIKSFPLLYKPEPIIIKVDGEDYYAGVLRDIIMQFRKNGYWAIGISQMQTEDNILYSYGKINIITQTEWLDFIVKSVNPDIVFVDRDIMDIPMEVDAVVYIDNEHEKFTIDNRDLDKEIDDEIDEFGTEYLGTFGDYGVSITGGSLNEINPEDIYAVGPIDEDKKQEIINSLLENRKKNNIMNSINDVEVFLKNDDIKSGMIVSVMEEYFS
jgi:hypothetical protein